jgi:hypothetical protein
MNKETSESSNLSEDSDVSSFHSDESYETVDSSDNSSEYDSESYDSDYSSYDSDYSSYKSRFECPHDTDDDCTCGFPSDYSRWSRSSSLREHTDAIFKNLKLTEKDGVPYYPNFHSEKTGTKRIKNKWKPVYRKWVTIHSKTLDTNKYDVATNLIKDLIETYKKNQSKDCIKNLYKIGIRLDKFVNYHKK